MIINIEKYRTLEKLLEDIKESLKNNSRITINSGDDILFFVFSKKLVLQNLMGELVKEISNDDELLDLLLQNIDNLKEKLENDGVH